MTRGSLLYLLLICRADRIEEKRGGKRRERGGVWRGRHGDLVLLFVAQPGRPARRGEEEKGGGEFCLGVEGCGGI